MRPNTVFLCICIITLGVLSNAANDKHGNKGPFHGNPHDNGRGRGHEKLLPKHGGCPQIEKIASGITYSRVAKDRTLAAKLLRLHYHDCFVMGCDASILLDSKDNSTAEKDAGPNRSITGYDVIDEIKAKLEEECPGEVSCADIVALAARDAVSFEHQKPLWAVPLGRKDGKISLASEASANLPSAGANFSTLLQQFQSNELDLLDLVALSGAHTIGVGHCGIISRRLFNFTGKNDTDPSIDKSYAEELKKNCSDRARAVDMDPGSALSFDSHYYVALNEKKGLFQSDAALLTNSASALIAKTFQNQEAFFAQFARSMIKMGEIGVITEDNAEGEIRKNCHFVN